MFSMLDLNSGYWLIEMDNKDLNKTVFVTQHGLLKYFWMPFGLKNVPATFQRATEVILVSVKLQHAFVYIHDVIIFSKTLE